MKRWLLVPLAVAATSMPAMAGEEQWSSQSGKTVFSMPIVTACYPGRGPIAYSTEFQGVKYNGTLWYKNVTGCRSAQTVISGYFEERNQNKGEWCSGNLTLKFNGSRGSATWGSIKAVPGNKCTGVGQSISFPLIQTGP